MVANSRPSSAIRRSASFASLQSEVEKRRTASASSRSSLIRSAFSCTSGDALRSSMNLLRDASNLSRSGCDESSRISRRVFSIPLTTLRCILSSTRSGTHHGLSASMRARIRSLFSVTAREVNRIASSSSSWCLSFDVTRPRTLPSMGATFVALMRSVRLWSMNACTSSSRSMCAPRASAPTTCLAMSLLFSGWLSHRARCSATRAERSFPRMTSRLRKLRWTNNPSVRPTRFFRAGMMPVCGIGRPNGLRKSAVTANQSASPPIIAASEAARTHASQGQSDSSRRVAI
jgi:hypothetical protein